MEPRVRMEERLGEKRKGSRERIEKESHCFLPHVRIVTGSAWLRAFSSNLTNLLVPTGSYFGVLNLRIDCRSGLTKGII